MPSDLFIVNNKNIWSFHLDSFTRPWYKTEFNFIYFVTLALNFLYPSFILHVLEMENVTARNENLILNSRSVYYNPGDYGEDYPYKKVSTYSIRI